MTRSVIIWWRHRPWPLSEVGSTRHLDFVTHGSIYVHFSPFLQYVMDSTLFKNKILRLLRNLGDFTPPFLRKYIWWVIWVLILLPHHSAETFYLSLPHKSSYNTYSLSFFLSSELFYDLTPYFSSFLPNITPEHFIRKIRTQ